MTISEGWKTLTQDLPPLVRQRVLEVLLITFFAVHVAWACGWLPGIDGFAQAAELRPLQEEVRDMRVEMLEESIDRARSLQCLADDPAARSAYTRRLQRSLRRYHELVGTPYQLDPCPRRHARGTSENNGETHDRLYL